MSRTPIYQQTYSSPHQICENLCSLPPRISRFLSSTNFTIVFLASLIILTQSLIHEGFLIYCINRNIFITSIYKKLWSLPLRDFSVLTWFFRMLAQLGRLLGSMTQKILHHKLNAFFFIRFDEWAQALSNTTVGSFFNSSEFYFLEKALAVLEILRTFSSLLSQL